MAHFSRLDRSKSADGLDLWPTVQEVLKTDLAEATLPYRATVRNGIGHGGVTYLQGSILYKDKKGNEERHEDREVIRLCDDQFELLPVLKTPS